MFHHKLRLQLFHKQLHCCVTVISVIFNTDLAPREELKEREVPLSSWPLGQCLAGPPPPPFLCSKPISVWATVVHVVFYAAVLSVVTQRSSPQSGRTLRDDTKNGCEGDFGTGTFPKNSKTFNSFFYKCLKKALCAFCSSFQANLLFPVVRLCEFPRSHIAELLLIKA